jgi:hypothetical protein
MRAQKTEAATYSRCDTIKFPLKLRWLRYQRVISLEIQIGITSERNKWANTDPQIYRRWDQVRRGSKYPLSTGRTRRVPHFKRKKSVINISVSKLGKQNNPLSKSVRLVKKTEQSAVKISTSSQKNGTIRSQNQYV